MSGSRMYCHNEGVTLLFYKVKEFRNQRKPLQIYHVSINTTTRAKRSPDSSVDISSLDKALCVRTHNTIALVEQAQLPDGCSRRRDAQKRSDPPPPVGIAAGGTFAGATGESSSFRWSTFDSTVQGIEITLSDGYIVWAS